jgi:glycosyltransferase involved in cell wall biosynthesis
MEASGIDVLMITFNRASYTRRALSELLRRSAPSTRVWVWHNGNDRETLEVVQSFREQLFRFHHSEENVRLTKPTNWLFENATGEYLSKVDDDCIVPERWDQKLMQAHIDEPKFGVIGCWRFPEEDFVPELAEQKIKAFAGGHRLLVNMWVEGSGYLIKRACVDRFGLLQDGRSFADYCIQIGRSGWVNGWMYPFLYQEHMDDPRAEHSELRTDMDLARHLPLSAQRNGVRTIEAWIAQLRRSARIVQSARIDPAYWSPSRRFLRKTFGKLARVFSGEKAFW